MNHDMAKIIAAEHAPKLLVDPLNGDMPNLLVVRKTEGGMPFSISLSSVKPEDMPDIPATEAQPEQAAQPGIEGHPGLPYVPAKPATAAISSTQRVAQQERDMLVHSLDAACQTLGVDVG